MDNSHGLPGLILLTGSISLGFINEAVKSDIIFLCTAFGSLAAGLYYIVKTFKKDKK
jgi:hypothetical protein